MSIHRIIFAAAALAACIAPAALADEDNYKTIVTIDGPIEIPGRVLNAGTYVFKLMESPSDRNVLQIFDKNEQHFIATVMTVPDYKMRTPNNPILKFEERSSSSPEALKAFFYPGNNYGLEFVYPHNQAAQIARRSNQNVLATRDDKDTQSVDNMRKAQLTRVNPAGENVDVKNAQ